MVAAFSPKTLAEALAIRKDVGVIPFAGGTDLMVRKRSWGGTLPKFEAPVLMIGGIPELTKIECSGDNLTIGAAVPLARILEHREAPAILKMAIAQMASPAIRNAGTLGGNIGNASPAADTLPPLYALGAVITLQSNSERREIPIAEFIAGPGKTVLREDELLTEIMVPLSNDSNVYYKKVGTRKADALSKVSFAGLALIEEGRIRKIGIALGAVAPTVVQSREAENFLKDRAVEELPGLIDDLKKRYADLIRPIDDQRSSAKYRRKVALGLIADFVGGLGRN